MRDENISMIWAQSRNGAIGINGRLPWTIPGDLKNFSDLTRHHIVIMGRKTWDSLNPRFKPLPHRYNVILTRDTSGATMTDPYLRVETCHDLEAFLKRHCGKRIFIIGGAEVYTKMMPRASKLYVTEVDTDIPDADAFAPAISSEKYRLSAVSSNLFDPFSGLTYRFKIYKKIECATASK